MGSTPSSAIIFIYLLVILIPCPIPEGLCYKSRSLFFSCLGKMHPEKEGTDRMSFAKEAIFWDF